LIVTFYPPNPPGLPTRLGFFGGIGGRAAGEPAMMEVKESSFLSLFQ